MAPIGRNIKAAMEAADITVDALAARIDVGPRLIQKWRQGVVQPRYQNLVKLAAALDRDPAWFYARHDEVDYLDEVPAA